MGPEATLVFLNKFYALSRGRCEQERPRLLVDIDPSVTDRNAAWRKGEDTPAAAIARMGRRLQRAGADFCVMPCVTAHGFAAEFETTTGLPLLRMPAVVAEALAASDPGETPIGLLATVTTIEMGLFQQTFSPLSLGIIVPDESHQAQLMQAIYALKRGEDARLQVLDVASHLAGRGARKLLIGCTDLSVLGPLDIAGISSTDALDLLAQRTLDEIHKT